VSELSVVGQALKVVIANASLASRLGSSGISGPAGQLTIPAAQQPSFGVDEFVLNVPKAAHVSSPSEAAAVADVEPKVRAVTAPIALPRMLRRLVVVATFSTGPLAFDVEYASARREMQAIKIASVFIVLS
jgi:hypothetical protein